MRLFFPFFDIMMDMFKKLSKTHIQRFLFWGILFIFGASSSLYAEVFRFRFKDGDTYRINSTVTEDVYLNGQFAHQAYITNRVTVEVSDVQPASNGKPFSALHTCTFMTSSKTATGHSRGDANIRAYSAEMNSVFTPSVSSILCRWFGMFRFFLSMM